MGAGASVDYGFPTGYKLIEAISSVCESLDSFYSGQSVSRMIYSEMETVDFLGMYIVENLNIRQNVAQSAVRKIGHTIWLSKSIDNYLNEQSDPNIKKIGKVLIFFLILKAEERSTLAMGKDDSLNFGKIRETWLMHFFRELRGSETNLERVRVRMRDIRIVNFNYDRTIEHFLIHAFSMYDNKSLQEAKEFIQQNLKIMHAYGELGVIAVDDTIVGFNNQVPFGLSSLISSDVMKNYQNIKLFT